MVIRVGLNFFISATNLVISFWYSGSSISISLAQAILCLSKLGVCKMKYAERHDFYPIGWAFRLSVCRYSSRKDKCCNDYLFHVGNVSFVIIVQDTITLDCERGYNRADERYEHRILENRVL